MVHLISVLYYIQVSLLGGGAGGYKIINIFIEASMSQLIGPPLVPYGIIEIDRCWFR